MITRVVYVHGLWLNGWESVLLRRRLCGQMGCETSVFSYSSVGAGAAANARALAAFLERMSADTLHLVAHSLGGLVVLELFESVLSADGRLPSGRVLPPGRIVLLGSPVQGSSAARHFARLPFGRSIIGLTANEMLVAPRARRWSGVRDLGVIAGSLPLGLGRLVGPLDGPNDGTVLVEETRLPGAVEHLTVRTSHSSLVYSTTVARQTAAFLRAGRFDPP
ncbi:MAG TPA: alpha/beta fold hydrolase [Steroidobacteraceae bacterium]